MKKFYLLFIVFLSFPLNSQASPYQFSMKKDLTLMGVAGGIGLIGIWQDGEKEDPTLTELNNLNPQDLWGVDRPYAGRWDPSANDMSNVMLATAMLSPGLLLFKEPQDYKAIGVLYVETQLAILAGVSLSKGLVTRYRPFTYGTDAPIEERLDADATRSFFSGHSAVITGSLVFSAKVFSDYYPKSKNKAWIWSGAFALAAFGSWQRVEAGRHFPTDVILGMSWGAAMGYWIPELHTSKSKSTSRLLPYLDGKQLGLLWQKEFN